MNCPAVSPLAGKKYLSNSLKIYLKSLNTYCSLKQHFSNYKFFERKKLRIGEQAAILSGLQDDDIKSFYIDIVYPKDQISNENSMDFVDELNNILQNDKIKISDVEPSRYMSLTRKVNLVRQKNLENSENLLNYEDPVTVSDPSDLYWNENNLNVIFQAIDSKNKTKLDLKALLDDNFEQEKIDDASLFSELVEQCKI
jgi:hypothetical protein